MKWGSIGKAFALVALAAVVIALCACPVPAPIIVALVCVAVYACYSAAQVLRDASNEDARRKEEEENARRNKVHFTTQPLLANRHDEQAFRVGQLSHGSIPIARGLYV